MAHLLTRASPYLAVLREAPPSTACEAAADRCAHSDASCFTVFPSVPQKASFVLLPANYRANDTFPFIEHAVSVPLTHAAVRCGGRKTQPGSVHSHCPRRAHKQGEDALDHSMLMQRFMTGSPEDRLEMLVASSLFMNFVLVVNKSVDFLFVVSLNKRDDISILIDIMSQNSW